MVDLKSSMEAQGKQRTQLGGSLLVPNVESLAASCHSASSVPHRYIRPELDADTTVDAAANQLPIIDLGTLLGEDSRWRTSRPHHAEKLLEISPHSDLTGLTVLLQVSPVQGLQVRRGARWVSVSPIPGGFVVNVGEVLVV